MPLVLVALAVLVVVLAFQRREEVTQVVQQALDSKWWRSSTAEKLGLDNTPDAIVRANLERVERAVAEVFGGSVDVTSGYRSPAVNEAVGGVRTSKHQRGMAADLVPPHGSPYTMGDIETKARASGRFSYVLNEMDHVHVEIA